MRETIRLILGKSAFPVILIAAIVQGWALYGLHQSVKTSSWPSTDPSWLAALYALVAVAPITVQLLCEHTKSTALWITLGIVSLAYFYFGWHYGSAIHDPSILLFDSDDFGATAFIMALLWLLMLPFIQLRLSTGTWRINYPDIFATAWRNKLLLAEAALFTGLFWLLLGLTAQLFYMLGIRFFKELFAEPLFIYPVTTLTFGIALHLIGSVERLTNAILEQVLSVLKWLAIIAGLILALFTGALLFKLPGLIFSGERAIGAAWLLWLVAVIVLLINAAYRDGRVEHPYPEWIAQSLRFVVPLTIVVSCTALYALVVRVQQYGVTVERVWAFVVAGTAILYAVGYSIAALRTGQWLGWIGRANVGVALALIATLAATLTPILSPHRLSANSQYRMALAADAFQILKPDALSDGESSLRYLRFRSGSYGLANLKLLAELQDHPDADRLRKESLAIQNLKHRGEPIPINVEDMFALLVISPPNREIDAKLRAKIIENASRPRANRQTSLQTPESAGLFVDLQGDTTEEFVLLRPNGGEVYEFAGGEWTLVARAILPARATFDDSENSGSMLENVKAGKVSVESARWKHLTIGPLRYDVQ